MQMQDKDIESIKVVEEGVFYILKTPSCFNSGHALFSSVLDITTWSLSKIENEHYLDNKQKQNEYLSSNSFAAKKLFVNMRGYSSNMSCSETF